MPRSVRGAPPVAIRMDFAKRLQDALNDKGWTQSELARRMAPLLKESRIGRDNISKYVRGKVLPLPPALEAMAKVLGVESKDLLPMRATSTASDELAPSSLRDIGGDRYWVQLNLALDADVALEIMRLVRQGMKKGGRSA
jgi:transcriptional regulator with XRE-family HTH domain